MRIIAAIFKLGLMLLLPLSAMAAKPEPAGCAILLNSDVYIDAPFSVTVVRVPRYPGQWFSPTVTVEVVAPIYQPASKLGPNRYTQTVSQTFPGLGGANKAETTLFIPSFTNLDTAGILQVYATVSEPVARGKPREAHCEAFFPL